MNAPQYAEHIARFTVGYAQMLMKDIPEEKFALLPNGIVTNHPAFVLSHLLIYPDRSLFEWLGRPELAEPFEKYEQIAAGGVDIRDDPGRTIYPPKDELIERFSERYTLAGEVAAQTGQDVFDEPNPMERFRDRMPTKGSVVIFLLGSHAMLHLGQVSAYRRMIGLGSAM